MNVTLKEFVPLISAEAYLPPVKVLNDAALTLGYVDVDSDAAVGVAGQIQAGFGEA